jgi:uncharacterized repeat protein (TIGR03847 family)
MSERHHFQHVDLFTAATEGRPGQRVFYLQVRQAAEVVTVKCEKQQVEALGQYLARLLADLPKPEPLPDAESLQAATPLLPEFVVGSISVAFNAEADRFVLEIEEAIAVDEEGEPEVGAAERQGAARFEIDRSQASAFASLATELVAAGRPPCRFCGNPLDPEGHMCPRMN